MIAEPLLALVSFALVGSLGWILYRLSKSYASYWRAIGLAALGAFLAAMMTGRDAFAFLLACFFLSLFPALIGAHRGISDEITRTQIARGEVPVGYVRRDDGKVVKLDTGREARRAHNAKWEEW